MSLTFAVPEAKALGRFASPSRLAPGQKAMSIAIYLHDLAGGGVERQSLIIAEELRRRGADVTLVLHSLRGQLVDLLPAGVRVIDLKGKRTLDDIPRLVRFLRTERPDVLLTNVDLNNVAALIAKSISFSPTKVVICQHNPIPAGRSENENWMYRYVGPAYRALAPVMSHAVAVSAGVAAELQAIAGLPADRVVTINNPVIGPDFKTRSEAHAEHRWFDQADHPVFVTGGRLVPQKDHETLLNAFALHRQHIDSRLIILGSGPLEAGLKALAASLGISNAVDFIGFQPNALPYFRRADAFVLSSQCEGFGNVIVEALGCGTPVISTRCEHGPAEILDQGRFGVLVPPRDAAALAAGLDQVRSLRQRFPVEMLKERADAFTYAACTSRYMTMFKALVPHRVWAV